MIIKLLVTLVCLIFYGMAFAPVPVPVAAVATVVVVPVAAVATVASL